MKKLVFFFIALLYISIALAQNVGIGTTTPATSAVLEVSSTTKGFLPPRMTIAQRNAITGKVAGLVIWCTNCVAPSGELQVFNGYSWTNMTGGITNEGTVTICNQVWVVKNLDVSIYKNGDAIPKVTDGAAWAALTTGAYCYYNNDSTMYAALYGKLYNWYAVNDPRGLAPEGWHIPTDAEWTTLGTCLGGNGVASGPMKEIGTTHWNAPNTGATNLSGFTSLPSGYRISNGAFSIIFGNDGIFWSSTEAITDFAWYRSTYYANDDLLMDSVHQRYGFSVRCLRD
jgi:uncharacterized protein (TIGR02145 family)